MAIKGKFEADFSDVNKGATEAEKNLASMATGADKAAASLSKVGNASTDINRLQGSLDAFDKTLGSAGVNIGSEVRALGELGSAAGKTAAELGAISTAGLALGAGIAGWNIGRAISEFFNLDAIIGKAATSLLGFEDLAAAEAGAGLDVLARASKIAGTEITNLGVATAIIKGDMKDVRTNAQQSAEALAGWHSQIAKVAKAGDLAQLTADLKSENFELERLSARYHLSVDAIKVYQRELTATAAAEKLAAQTTAASNAEKLAQVGRELAQHKAVRELDEAATLTATKLANESMALRAAASGNSFDKQRADVERWKNDTIAAAKKAGTDTALFYSNLAEDANLKLSSIGSDWANLSQKSQESLQEQADAAERDYNRMQTSGEHFNRTVLDEQYEKWQKLRDAARGMGEAGVKAVTDIANATPKATLALDDMNKKITESYTIGFETLADVEAAVGLSPEVRAKLEAYFKEKEKASTAISGATTTTRTAGRDTTAAEVSSGGPEDTGGGAVRVTAPQSAGGGGIVVNNYINGTGLEVGRQIEDYLIKNARLKGIVAGAR